MARESKVIGKAYHCDGYYFPKVCANRDIFPDAADVRKRKGWIAARRHLCKNFGIREDGKVCWHCVEWKYLFRGQEPRVLLREDNGRSLPTPLR